jgi:hypothetical protein
VVWEVAAEPVRDGRGQGGDDDLVESASLNCPLHGGEGITLAHDPFDVPSHDVLEQRDGEFERGRGLFGLRVPVGARHQQGEVARGLAGTGPDLIEQPRRRRGPVSHDQHARGCRGCHPAMIVASLRRPHSGPAALG